MKKMVLFSLLSLSCLFASSIKVENAYARATPPNMPNSAAFMELKNETNNDISLVSASSTAANITELHTHDMKDGVMKMYQVPQIDIKANSTTVLQPGGFHIMLIKLVQKPLKENDEVTLTLKFSNDEEQTITIPVKTVMGGMMQQKSMNQMNHGNMKH
ncbi:MAG: copper chaperone PCu(A)C [Arcobacteraceae bacterium]